MLGIQKVETALEAIKNTAIRNHIESAYTAALEIDKSGLKVAYHVACIKPLLEGNTDGLPTDFVKFAEQKLGLKKAQAYNMLMVGNDVEMVYDENGKNPIYIDSFTQGLIEERYDLKTQWKDYYKALKKAKTLGTTQLLTIRRMQTKYNFEDVDIQLLMDKGIINAGLTIKALETAIRSQFNAIETKADETETKTEESKAELATKVAQDANETANKLRNDDEKTMLITYRDMCAIMSMCVKCHDTVPVSAELYNKFLADTEFAKYYENFLEKAKEVLKKSAE